MAAPVAKGEELELDIDSLAYGGNGVARLNGFVVFVRRGLPGDRVRARVTKVKGSHAEAVSVELLEPGTDRVDAPCPHFGACGGCRLQDLGYDAQLRAKELQVRDALERIGRLSAPSLEPIVPTDPPYEYRNKLEYSFTPTPQGPALGFHRAGRWDEVLDIERCLLTTPLGNAIRAAVRDWARSAGRSLTAQWMLRTSGNRSRAPTNASVSSRPGAVTSTTSTWPVLRPSRTTRCRRKPSPPAWS